MRIQSLRQRDLGCHFVALLSCAALIASGQGQQCRADPPSPRLHSHATKPTPALIPGNQCLTTEASQLDLFEALEKQVIQARFIPLSSQRATLILSNLSDQPVDIQLPATFAAIRVLAQFGGPNGGFGQGGFGQGDQASQGLGGGFPGGNVGGGGFGNLGGGFNNNNLGPAGFGNQPGMFRLTPAQSRKLSVPCVCLEYGKPDPTPRMQYQIVPLDHLCAKPEVKELCVQLANGKVEQPTAQAAAWHLANGLSWEALQKLKQHESPLTGNIPRFTPRQLKTATELVRYCRGQAQASNIATTNAAGSALSLGSLPLAP
jgi:hypothetical protein